MKNPFFNSPLKSFPYNSRVYANEFSTTFSSKNYVFVAFTPGSALQASELNEVQETFYKNTTLYNIMFKNWLFFSDSFLASDDTLPIRGPSWVGAVPLNPVTSITITEGESDTQNITFIKDWYLVDDPSGLKFWVYNNIDLTIIGLTNGYYGVGITYGYVPGTEADLTDNSGGYPGSIIPGADRYQINITEAQFHGDQPAELSILQRSILYKKNSDDYSYLNNLLYPFDEANKNYSTAPKGPPKQPPAPLPPCDAIQDPCCVTEETRCWCVGWQDGMPPDWEPCIWKLVHKEYYDPPHPTAPPNLWPWSEYPRGYGGPLGLPFQDLMTLIDMKCNDPKCPAYFKCGLSKGIDDPFVPPATCWDPDYTTMPKGPQPCPNPDFGLNDPDATENPCVAADNCCFNCNQTTYPPDSSGRPAWWRHYTHQKMYCFPRLRKEILEWPWTTNEVPGLALTPPQPLDPEIDDPNTDWVWRCVNLATQRLWPNHMTPADLSCVKFPGGTQRDCIRLRCRLELLQLGAPVRSNESCWQKKHGNWVKINCLPDPKYKNPLSLPDGHPTWWYPKQPNPGGHPPCKTCPGYKAADDWWVVPYDPGLDNPDMPHYP